MSIGAPGSAAPPRPQRFPRAHRLKRQRLIRPLFDTVRADVHATRKGPITVRYRLATIDDVGADVPLQIGFAVGRGIGDKPARNRVKRILREVYRVHQHALVDLFSDRPDVLTLMVLYRGRLADARTSIPRALPELLGRVAEAVPSRTRDAHPPS